MDRRLVECNKIQKAEGRQQMAVKVYGSEERSIILAGMEIRYVLTRKSVKNVNLRIDAAGNVKVSAPRRVPVDHIERFLCQHQGIIVAAVERAEKNSCLQGEKQPQLERQYVDGEYLNLLGERLGIRVLESRTECIELGNGYLYFRVKNPGDRRHKELMYEKWLRSYQREVYENICHQVHEQFRQYRVDYPMIRIRRMTSRWGSCQPYRGIVTLNSRLIETPLSCIRYVAMHEFCHFIHPNHSREFYALMTRMMPDWKQQKQLLNSIKEWN